MGIIRRIKTKISASPLFNDSEPAEEEEEEDFFILKRYDYYFFNVCVYFFAPIHLIRRLIHIGSDVHNNKPELIFWTFIISSLLVLGKALYPLFEHTYDVLIGTLRVLGIGGSPLQIAHVMVMILTQFMIWNNTKTAPLLLFAPYLLLPYILGPVALILPLFHDQIVVALLGEKSESNSKKSKKSNPSSSKRKKA